MSEAKCAEDLQKELKRANEVIEMMESRLIQAGKVSVLGQLSAGIAHELKQPLTGIVGFVEDALEETEDDSSVRESLNIIKREAERMQDIIDGIRKFSRASGENKEDIDINAVLNDSLLLLSKQLANNNIIVEISLSEDLPKVHANASQMQQVFVNMISNAKDAMEAKGGGTLRVISILSEDGKCIQVNFEDTGCGMPKDVIKRLSEPFFTTKGPDKGTGLGTSISFSIIKMHNGTIDIASKVGSGTTIGITIPISS